MQRLSISELQVWPILFVVTAHRHDQCTATANFATPDGLGVVISKQTIARFEVTLVLLAPSGFHDHLTAPVGNCPSGDRGDTSAVFISKSHFLLKNHHKISNFLSWQDHRKGGPNLHAAAWGLLTNPTLLRMKLMKRFEESYNYLQTWSILILKFQFRWISAICRWGDFLFSLLLEKTIAEVVLQAACELFRLQLLVR